MKYNWGNLNWAFTDMIMALCLIGMQVIFLAYCPFLVIVLVFVPLFGLMAGWLIGWSVYWFRKRFEA